MHLTREATRDLLGFVSDRGIHARKLGELSHLAELIDHLSLHGGGVSRLTRMT